jgi:hypothetical protein
MATRTDTRTTMATRMKVRTTNLTSLRKTSAAAS